MTEHHQKQEAIAIVGLGCVFPQANNTSEYWNNIVNGVDCIQEVPKEKWDPALFWDPDPKAEDKTHVKIGGFTTGYKFNPLEFRIPPRVAEHLDLVQKLALSAAKEALEDAGISEDKFDKERTAVILGNTMGGSITSEYARRVFYPQIVQSLEASPEYQGMTEAQKRRLLVQFREKYTENLATITEDSMPGELANIIAGRIANVFNLRGQNFTTDAACASALAATVAAIHALQTGSVDAVVCGGADATMDPPCFVKFCKIGALSAEGSYPFDERAGGFVMGEGAGFFVMKRLSDAIRQKDKIYAVITGSGGASDGKGKGITAPNPVGQKMAVKRAWDQAGITPRDLQIIEAHGTATIVGDVVELHVVDEIIRSYGDIPPQSIPIGSVKSQIGHLKSAAGAASVIKMAMALHHKVLPASINAERPNPKFNWKDSPIYINTETTDWDVDDTTLRRAGVSAFGFGGTNFHIVMEEFDPRKPGSRTQTQSIVEPAKIGSDAKMDAQSRQDYVTRNADLQAETYAFSAPSKKDLTQAVNSFAERLSQKSIFEDPTGTHPTSMARSVSFDMNAKHRIAIAAKDYEAFLSQWSLLNSVLDSPEKLTALWPRGVFSSEVTPSGKTAFVFSGQGSQYANMLSDMRAKFSIIDETFREADEILADSLPNPLSSYIFTEDTSQIKNMESELKQTKITQPAVFVAGIALLRLLRQFGVEPNMVAGHSLGEYAALVAAGVLEFKDGLKAVAERGKAMSEVDAKDKGTMASIGASADVVEEILKNTKGYVIAANKNSPKQTVISGATEAVTTAVDEFRAIGLDARLLQVSAAFHTEIVAPAAKRLRKFLKTITFKTPRIPVLSNVTGGFFPEDPKEIRALLVKQVESPVRWIEQVQTMNEAGATYFVEIGPKRALSSFVQSILDPRSVLALASNHPKKGGIQTFNEVIAAFSASGLEVKMPKLDSEVFSSGFRWPVLHDSKARHVQEPSHRLQTAGRRAVADGSDPILDSFMKSQGPALRKAIDDAFSSYKQGLRAADPAATRAETLGLNLEPLVVTGVGMGLPGVHKEIFDENNAERILSGENMIDPIPHEDRLKQTTKNITRVVKKERGGGSFAVIDDVKQVIKLAARKGKFDLVEEYQIAEKLIDTLDITTKLAVAAGLEAMKDAGIPLVRSYIKTSTGGFLPGDWALPEELQDETGIIFSSAFPGYDNLVKDISQYFESRFGQEKESTLQKIYEELAQGISDPKEKEHILEFVQKEISETRDNRPVYEFSRKYLYRILSMGHAQFAQIIKARGPNTQTNAACASMTQALGIAQDWIRAGRCKRVILISADDVTSENLLEWIAAGFLSIGAATTQEDVAQAALPFDRRRHGMIIGMGASSIVLEAESEAKRRGVAPIAELLGTYAANSAFHGSRLNVNHITSEMAKFMQQMVQIHRVSSDEIAESAVFMSHETYTPARGGSASAEIQALRAAFGDKANQIHIANTKGFTGHAMGAGIEDAVVLKSLEFGKIPPIANFEQPDPELGDLRISRGLDLSVKYAIRLAAGFGSQLAFALYRKRDHSKNRLGSPKFAQWLRSIGGTDQLIHVGKTLRLTDTGPPSRTKKAPAQQPSIPARVAVTPQKPKAVTAGARIGVTADKESVRKQITQLIAKQTGYPEDMLDPELGMEEDLGIDTVKQAELFGTIREIFNLHQMEGLQIADYPTINHIVEYVVEKTAGGTPTGTPQATASGAEAISTPAVRSDHSQFVKRITELIAEQTGYPTDMLDPELQMEADLGIDTVKQAELFALIREEFGLALQEGMQIADYPTILRVADFVVEAKGASATIPQTTTDTSATSTTVVATSAASAAKETDVAATVLEIIASHTGYPQTMLESELEFEQDLGVKDADLQGLLDDVRGKLLPSKTTVKIRPTEAKTVGSLIQIVSQLRSGTAPTTPSPTPSAASTHVIETATTVPQDIQKRVVAMISAQTGYPTDMLDPKLDMEGDLGIDTVKQAELFALLREEFSLPFDEELQIADYPTIEAVVKFVAVKTSGSQPIPEQAATSQPSMPQEPEGLRERIVAIVSEQTGYPTDMLDPELQMEADLGIDTVKQAELFALLREEFSLPFDEELQIADYPTINAVIGFVASKTSSTTEKHPSPSGEPASDALDASGEPRSKTDVRRYVLRTVPSETQPDHVKENALPGHVFVLAHPKNADLPVITKKLKECTVVDSISKLNIDGEATLVILDADEKLTGSPSDINLWLKENAGKIKLVLLARRLSEKETSPFERRTPHQSALAGMFKACAREVDTFHTRIVELEKPDQLHAELRMELVHKVEEIIYSAGVRRVVALLSNKLPRTQWRLPETAAILVTGGAQGITYACLSAIVSPGNNVAILGRTAVREDASEIANMTKEDLKARKDKLLTELRSTQEKVTPVVLEAQWRKITKSADVWNALNSLKKRGINVQYYPADVRDAKSVAHAVSDAQKKFGRSFDYLVHGAGVEISKSMATKSQEEFKLVYDVKANGFDNLLDSLDISSLKRVMAFTSVAGRFGNAGQIDYSATNEYLAQRCRLLRHEGIDATAIDWSAWSGFGMATRGSTMTVLSAAGITAIPPDEGTAVFSDEFAQGSEAEVVVCGQLGLFAASMKLISSQANEEDFDTDFNSDTRLTMIDGLRQKNSGTWQATRMLNLERDLYLNDHRIAKTPVLPGVMGIEIFVQTAKHVLGDDVWMLSDMKFQSAVKLLRDQPLEILAEIEPESSRIQLKSRFVGKDGKQLGELREHFQGTAHLGVKQGSYPLQSWKNSAQPLLQRKHIYAAYFHGPSFQVLDSVLRSSPGQIMTKFRRPSEPLFSDKNPRLETDALAVEAAFQTAGLVGMLQQKASSLPSFIGQLIFYSGAKEPELIMAVLTKRTERHSIYNVYVVDAEDRLVVELREYGMINTASIPEDMVPPLKKQPRREVEAIQTLAMNASNDIQVADAKLLATASVQELETILTDAELQAHAGFKVAKRRNEWLAGVVAAKRAVQLVTPARLNEIYIRKDANRKPAALVREQQYPISITHSHGVAMSVCHHVEPLTEGDVPQIGIDLEKIEQKPAAFIKEAFSSEEIEQYPELTSEETVPLQFWCAKEAYLKKIGVGLKADLRKVRVTVKDRATDHLTVHVNSDLDDGVKHTVNIVWDKKWVLALTE